MPPDTPAFPKYTDHDPAVPVWCVTPNRGGAIHRFFDTSPFSPSGRYLAVLRMPFEDRLPQPGDEAEVVLIDLEAGEERAVATTRGWDSQLGANINWGADDHQLIFNDVDPADWSAFAVRLDPFTGEKARLGGTVYHVSPDGRWAASACMKRMRRTQYGYGVVVPPERVPRNIGLREDDGFTLTDTRTGESHMLASIRQLVDAAGPEPLRGGAEGWEVYGFHSKWSPSGDRLILTLRWYPDEGVGQWDMNKSGKIHFCVYTIRPDGSEIHAAVGPEQWDKGGHHINFYPDGKALSMNLDLAGDGLSFCRVDVDGRNIAKIVDEPRGSGHPSIHPDGRHLLTDTYTHRGPQWGVTDGTSLLRWVDLTQKTAQTLGRVPTHQPVDDPAMRIDPHPAWDRSWQWIAFNGQLGGTRRVFVADLRSCLQAD